MKVMKNNLGLRFIIRTCAICFGFMLFFGALYIYMQDSPSLFLKFGLGFVSLLSLGIALAYNTQVTLVRPLKRLWYRVGYFRAEGILGRDIAEEMPAVVKHELDEIELFLCELMAQLQVEHHSVLATRNNLVALNKNLEAELESRRQHIENQIAETSQQNKIAALGEMAAGIAHEINNPLAILVGRVEQLREQIGREQRFDPLLNNMEKTLFRIQEAVMDLELIASNPSSEHSRRLTLNRVIRRLNKVAANRYELHEVEFNLHLHDDIEVEGREVELTQALLYLLENAAQAAAKSDAKWVDLHLRRHGQGACEIVIRDSGTGIAESIREKVFQPFFTTKEKGRGTGLSIARSIIEAHGGNVAFDFEEETTTLRIELPCLISEQSRVA